MVKCGRCGVKNCIKIKIIFIYLMRVRHTKRVRSKKQRRTRRRNMRSRRRIQKGG
jgi:hypothetical protein